MFGQTTVDGDLAAALHRSRTLRPYLGRVVAVFNGKGGVGKTTLVSNIGGLLALAAADARSPRRVLLVDCDPQGNLGLDLGYARSSGDDGGAGLMAALQAGTAPPRIRDVRPWLDVIPGGAALDEVNGLIFGKTARGKAHEGRLVLAEVLATVAHEYDWIILDCPPREINIQDVALVAARGVLVPVSFDQASRQGLTGVAERFSRSRQLNEMLELLGVAMFGFQYRPRHRKKSVDPDDRDPDEEIGQRRDVRAELQADLRQAGSDAPVFRSVVRYMPSVAKACRDRGQLVYELETAHGPKWWEIRAGTATGRPVPSTEAAKVAQEYEDLAAEVFTRFMQMEQVAQA
jgi:cellulose biosynthesis protein BcsQ